MNKKGASVAFGDERQTLLDVKAELSKLARVVHAPRPKPVATSTTRQSQVRAQVQYSSKRKKECRQLPRNMWEYDADAHSSRRHKEGCYRSSKPGIGPLASTNVALKSTGSGRV